MFGKNKANKEDDEPVRCVSFKQRRDYLPKYGDISVNVEKSSISTAPIEQAKETSLTAHTEVTSHSKSEQYEHNNEQMETVSHLTNENNSSDLENTRNSFEDVETQNIAITDEHALHLSLLLNKVAESANPNESEHLESEETEPPLNRIMRRKSVFAEAYNPEEEEDESERIIHAKSDEQRSRLGENVKNIFLFRSLDHDQIAEVLDAMFERRVTAGEYVIKQGDDGDNFYVIETGVFNIYVQTELNGDPKHVGTYDNSGSFGELALMYNLPRAATIQAITPGSLWAMDRQTFRRIVLNAAYKKRKMYESLLEKVPMLKTLQNYERMNLADALVPRLKVDGELIIKQGDAADGMYFVEEGSCKVVMTNSDQEEKEISRVTVGGYFGELALVTKKPRAASIYAVGKVRLAFLDVEAFERLLGPCMEIMKRNIEDYENELLRIFGSKANISDIR